MVSPSLDSPALESLTPSVSLEPPTLRARCGGRGRPRGKASTGLGRHALPRSPRIGHPHPFRTEKPRLTECRREQKPADGPSYPRSIGLPEGPTTNMSSLAPKHGQALWRPWTQYAFGGRDLRRLPWTCPSPRLRHGWLENPTIIPKPPFRLQRACRPTSMSLSFQIHGALALG